MKHKTTTRKHFSIKYEKEKGRSLKKGRKLFIFGSVLLLAPYNGAITIISFILIWLNHLDILKTQYPYPAFTLIREENETGHCKLLNNDNFSPYREAHDIFRHPPGEKKGGT